MKIVGIVPVKPLGVALGRLAGVLDAPTRRELQMGMLADVLATCHATKSLADVLVVTADPEAADLARTHGARVIADHDPPQGMNPAVIRGLAAAIECGADAALVLTADLPVARSIDFEAVIAAAADGEGVTLVPSHDGTGTNALLVRPPDVFIPELGVGSRARHREQARRRQVSLHEFERPAIALDVDTPADLALFVAGASHGIAQEICTRRGVAALLRAGSLR
jgi:2-phospho-L-lactate/phosphoenolpyruvate guanylyltransferase